MKFKDHAGLIPIRGKEPPPVKLTDPDRPLIDKLQEATFGEATTMQWVTDKYALRMLLRKAHCFNVDSTTSALISDFSIAVAQDLEAARHLAIPPFPVTWFEIDNVARLKRIKELGIPLTSVAAGDDVIPKVGWLITQNDNSCCASYVGEFDAGIFVAPTSFHWSINEKNCVNSPIKINGKSIESEASPEVIKDLNRLSHRICFGMSEENEVKTDFYHVTFGPASFQGERFGNYENKVMRELWGELRHIFGLLIAMGTSTSEVGQPTRHVGPPVIMKGKPLFALEHKTLKISLGKRKTVAKVVEVAFHGVRKRWHEVRAHTRLLASGRRIPVKSHARGDESLGKITKTYVVEK